MYKIKHYCNWAYIYGGGVGWAYIRGMIKYSITVTGLTYMGVELGGQTSGE